MTLDRRQQTDLFHEATPSDHRLPGVERERVKAWLGELIVSVWEEEARVDGRR
jgi:hypothetical protein